MTELYIPTTTFQSKVSFAESGSFLLIYPEAVYSYSRYAVIGLSWREEKDKGDKGRNWDNEIELAHRIASFHPDLNLNTNQDFFQIEMKEALSCNWLMDFSSTCKAEGIKVSFENLTKINLTPNKAHIGSGLSSGIDWLEFKPQVCFGEKRVSIKELRRAVSSNDKKVKLENNTWGILSDEWMALLQPVFMFGKRNGDAVRLTRNQFPILKSLKEEIDFSAKVEERINEFLSEKKVVPVLSQKIKAKPRAYQMGGFEWLVNLSQLGFGGCLADDMGLGKTLQMLMYICWYIEDTTQPKPILVVCPQTLLFNWGNEIEKFAPHLSTYTHWGTKRTKDKKDIEAVDVVLTSYGTMMNDIAHLQTIPFGVVVLDESQAIKNATSKRTYAAKQLFADHRFIMTGTPVENNAFELWSQMDFINPGLLGSFYQFKQQFSGVIARVEDQSKAVQLQKLVKPYILRRLKSQVAKELPEKIEMNLYCDMETEQRRLYEKYRKNTFQQIESEADTVNQFKLLTYLLRLRQVCNSTHLVDDQGKLGKHSIKIKILLEHIQEKHRNHKILVFSQFLGMIEQIALSLDQHNIAYCQLTGASKNRQALVDSFENDVRKRVFLISIKAGGTGLNLTSADYVYIVDPWWNPAVENQAIDRAYRIGQTKKVMAYRMICRDTIEEKIQLLQQRKQHLSDELIHNDEDIMKRFDKADFMTLLDRG